MSLHLNTARYAAGYNKYKVMLPTILFEWFFVDVGVDMDIHSPTHSPSTSLDSLGSLNS
jgi:hypothetical protein